MNNDKPVKQAEERRGKIPSEAHCYTGTHTMACYNCGDTLGLVMMPHRNENGLIVGWLFACNSCWDDIAGKELEVRAA